jgi:hypothetical protein
MITSAQEQIIITYCNNKILITSAQEQIITIYFKNIIIITSAGADGDDALGGREGHGGVSEGMEYPEYPLQ